MWGGLRSHKNAQKTWRITWLALNYFVVFCKVYQLFSSKRIWSRRIDVWHALSTNPPFTPSSRQTENQIGLLLLLLMLLLLTYLVIVSSPVCGARVPRCWCWLWRKKSKQNFFVSFIIFFVYLMTDFLFEIC